MCLALIQLRQMTFEGAKGDKDSILSRVLCNYRNPDQFPSNLKLNHGDRMWEFLFQLFESPWWQRAWVVQEVYCSPNTMIVFGGIGMSFSAIAAFNVHMLQLVAHMVMELNETSYIDSLCALSGAGILISAGNSALLRGVIEFHFLRQTADRHIPLLQALDMVGHQHCTHGRDKVIAALGIASMESSKINLPGLPNLSDKPEKEIPFQLLLHVVETFLKTALTGHNLDFLGSVPICRFSPISVEETTKNSKSSPSIRKLPSWMPDWTHPRMELGNQFSYNRLNPPKIPIEYSGDDFRPQLQNDHELLVKGWTFDRIKSVLTEKDKTISSPSWREFDHTMSLNLSPEFEGIPGINSASLMDDFYQLQLPSQRRIVEDGLHLGYLHKEYWGHATTNGQFHAIVPQWSRPGDWICSFIGGSVLYVIRSTDGDCARFTFVGEAYLFGEMDNLYRDGDPKSFLLL
jgi:hypothetical protein